MRIKDQMQKELFIFQKLGYMCKKADYINEFQNLYPDDIDYLCRIFQTDAEHTKTTKKYVKDYLGWSFVNGRLRYKIDCGLYPDTRNLNNRD